MFVKIAEAYEILSDPVKRNKYDSYYFSGKSRFQSKKSTKTYKNSPESPKSSESSSNGWGFSFTNPFDIFNHFFPNLDRKVIKVFSKAVSHMKTVTNHEFLIKLMDEYRYFTKNKNYHYDDSDESDNNDKRDDSYIKRDTFDEYRRRKRHDYLKQKYNANINLNKFEYRKSKYSSFNSFSLNTPPKQIYELEISLVEYLQEKRNVSIYLCLQNVSPVYRKKRWLPYM